jgi:hypothetical protein
MTIKETLALLATLTLGIAGVAVATFSYLMGLITLG